ncbi:MAG TPA: leucine-rich repeat protein [Prolixibacteraceae bacterium]|nr:leucine-rich repeat protein [Prolixibacteraceae bacterium]
MKAITILIISLFLATLAEAQVSRTVELTAGSLNTELTAQELNTITDLTITGTMNSRDFRTMRDSMPVLTVLDISEVNILAYEGMEGTNNFGNIYDSWGIFPVDEIPMASFTDKVSLQSVLFPLSCKAIGSAAFSDCTGLAGELHLPSGITRIETNAFIHCSSLTGELIIPPLVTHVEGGIFAGCSGITSLTIPPSVKQIEPGAFSGCSGLQLIEAYPLPPILLTISQEVFKGVDFANCTLMVPYETRELYASALVWKEFTSIIEHESGFLLSDNSLQLTHEGGADSSIHLKANVAWQVTSDQEWLSVSPASGNTDQIITVSVEPNPGLSSREGALVFSSEGLYSQSIHVKQDAIATAVNITPGSLKEALSEEEKQSVSTLILTGSMDARDFNTIRYQMPLLEVLDIREVTIEAYTDTTFGNTINHPKDAIPFAIHEWSDDFQTSYALSEHKKLAVVKLPHTLKTIGYRAFFACGNLKTVEMQSLVTDIRNEAFLYCASLTSVNLSSSLTTIGEMAFQGCASLPSIELPSALKKIDYYAFGECRALKSIVIPPSVTSLESYAFKGCSSLESVTIPSSITIIRVEAFMGCSSLTSVVIPPHVTLIEGFAFRDCSSLGTLTLPATLTSLLPAAFADCISLDTIYSYAVTPPDLDNPGGWDVFDNVDKANCMLYVPKGTKEVYASAFGWKEFANIVEMDEFSLSDTTVTLEAGANSQATVELHSSLAWTASSDEEWLRVNPETGSSGHQLTLTAEANPLDTARTAIVTIAADDMDSLILTVTQKALTVGLDELESKADVKYYPNPFTHEMAIEIANPSLMEVSIEIYSISGQKVRTLAKAHKGAKITLFWDGADEQGQKVPYGAYLLKVNEQTRKVMKR